MVVRFFREGYRSIKIYTKDMQKYNIITLCGSTRFKDEFLRVQKELTLQGNIVISVGLFGHSGDDEVWDDGVKEMLDDMHLAKIDLADEIFVINVDGYIGKSTAREISYAKACGKKVRSLVPLPEDAYSDQEVLKVLVNKKVKDYIYTIAADTGTTEDFVLKTIIGDYETMLKEQDNK